eukprot:m.109625 g.109625  ORF g.109625 m.109625 type:complete len:84 (+) comp37357_c0_seq1:484-735(+)
MGVVGPTGLSGPPGSQGPLGNTGVQGPTGNSGAKGQKGTAGQKEKKESLVLGANRGQMELLGHPVIQEIRDQMVQKETRENVD